MHREKCLSLGVYSLCQYHNNEYFIRQNDKTINNIQYKKNDGEQH